MKERGERTFDPQELAASLEPLGIREITERMEVSPLLVDQGDLVADQNHTICCTCKFPNPTPDEAGMLPYQEVEPPIGSPTGPTGGLIWPW